MATDTLALVGASCEATGHPSVCGETASGTVQDADNAAAVTLDGDGLATHGDRMHFPSHGHAVSPTGGCTDYQTHDLVPDQSPPITVDGNPVMRVGDSTTDPRSGGTASIVDAGGTNALTHTHG
ncbi:hypothetical protein ACFQMF_01540 [Halorubrum rutilum]|uniref:Uncharacterized protein n=1 Tax=Halorubrum rutilum TaxID=1364933 RepID=A0ABD6AG98_9EURY|nr:hypothetical protein [Halorubrum rutilum]